MKGEDVEVDINKMKNILDGNEKRKVDEIKESEMKGASIRLLEWVYDYGGILGVCFGLAMNMKYG